MGLIKSIPTSKQGLFATAFIPKGSVVWHDHDNWPDERHFTMEQISKIPKENQDLFATYKYQVEDTLFSGPTTLEEVRAVQWSFIWFWFWFVSLFTWLHAFIFHLSD